MLKGVDRVRRGREGSEGVGRGWWLGVLVRTFPPPNPELPAFVFCISYFVVGTRFLHPSLLRCLQMPPALRGDILEAIYTDVVQSSSLFSRVSQECVRVRPTQCPARSRKSQIARARPPPRFPRFRANPRLRVHHFCR